MIKYHLNGVGNEYGADHTLTNNWNPDKDYGNEYTDVHLRIEARDYQYPFNNFTPENSEQFYNEVYDVFESLGWEINRLGRNGSCTTIKKGKQNLYLHPQDFSGEVLKNDVKQIAEALEQRETFKLRWVDIYKTVYDISDNEYRTYLENRKDEIRKQIFEGCQTKRINQYRYLYDVKCRMADAFKLRRINIDEGLNHGGQTVDYVQSIIDEMVEEGLLLLVVKNNNNLIRSPNKTEQKKMKISICV